MYPWSEVACPAGAVVDTDFVKLYAENLWAELLALDSNDHVRVKSGTERNKVRVSDLVVKSGNGFSRSGVLLRDLRVGDRVRYSYLAGSTEYTGTSKVVGFEADTAAAVTGAVDVKSTNADASASAGTVYDADGVAAGSLEFLSDGPAAFPGMYAEGVVADTITVRITTGGVAGTAKAAVTYASGAYSRANADTVIEATPDYTGRLYVGNGMYIDFDTDTFVAGAVFTVAVSSEYSALAGTELTVSGVYEGDRDTTYAVEVVRGGCFDRFITVMPGISTAKATSTFAADVGAADTADWAAWTGGDRDFEYVLRCTTAGSLSTARFSLWSPYDVQSGIGFTSSGHSVSLGSYGIVGKFTQSQAENFAVGDQWVIRVNASRPQVRISDSIGVDASGYKIVTVGVDFDLGVLGLSAQFAANADSGDHDNGGLSAVGGLVKGDVFYVPVAAAYATEIRTLVLADSVNAGIDAGADMDLSVYSFQSSKRITARNLETNIGDYNYLADADDGLTVYAGLRVQDPSWVNELGEQPWLDLYRADLYVEYRALRTDNADAIHAITDISDVTAAVGPAVPENPLGLQVFNCLSNSGNRAVYYMAVPSNDSAGWTSVLRQAGLTNRVYGFAPASQDADVIDLVVAHVKAQSTETSKKWRIAFVSAEMPTQKAVYTQATQPDGDRFYATLTDDGSGDNFLLTFVDDTGGELPSGYVNCLDDVVAGDSVRIAYASDPWGDETYAEYTVARVISNTQVLLSDGPTAAIDRPERVEVYHPYSIAERAQAYADISAAFYSARVYNVFPPRFGSNGLSETGEFGAGIVAGLCSSVPPQQPLTNITVSAIDDVPMAYQTFTADELNLMAGSGTLILMQESVGDTVYVRHQVSTKASGGNLNETELSMIKNLDSVSYYFANRLAPYVGKYNISPSLLNVIDNVLKDGVDYLGSMTAVGLLSPQLDLETTTVTGVAVHPTLKDHIVGVIDLGMPVPGNNIQLKLVV